MARKTRMPAKSLTEDIVLQLIKEYDEYSNAELAKRIGVSSARLTKLVNTINEKSKAKGEGVILGSKNLRKQDDVINNALDIYFKEKAGK
jgi:DNA-binding CsgD family transcriptional regulator